MTKHIAFLLSFLLFCCFGGLSGQTEVCNEAYFGIARDEGSQLEFSFVEIDVETGAFTTFSDYRFPNSFALGIEGIVDNQFFFLETFNSSQREVVFIDLADGSVVNRIPLTGNISSLTVDNANNSIVYFESIGGEFFISNISLDNGTIQLLSQGAVARAVVGNSAFIDENRLVFIRILSSGVRQIVEFDLCTGMITKVVNLVTQMGDFFMSSAQLFDYNSISAQYFSVEFDLQNPNSPAEINVIDVETGIVSLLNNNSVEALQLLFGANGIVNSQFYFVNIDGDNHTLNFINLSDGTFSGSVPIAGPLFHLQFAEVCDEDDISDMSEAIPTLSQWAMMLLTLLMLIVSMIALRSTVGYRKRPV